MKDRKQFTFYRSYFDVVMELPDQDKLPFLMALFNKEFFNQEPVELTGMAKLAYVSQKHSIDKQVEGFINKTKDTPSVPPSVGPSQPPTQPPSVGPSVPPSVQEQEEEQEEEQEKEEGKGEEQEEVQEQKKYANMKFEFVEMNYSQDTLDRLNRLR
jgi:hypothetical protein